MLLTRFCGVSDRRLINGTFAGCALLLSAIMPAVAQQSVVATADGARLDEIVVTAQKRTERLQDVPVPVTAIDAQSLLDSHQLAVQDYFTTVPGLNLVSGNTLSIRGLTTAGSFANPTIGITIDDVPFGPSNGLAFAGSVPDIDPSSLQRIEVLRGPQGTLYGAASIGGLLRYVTREAATDALSGQVQAEVSSTSHGDGVGYGLRGSVNLPVSDVLAFRVSGVSRREAGYIDDPSQGRKGVNDLKTTGGSLSALWRPSDALSVKLGVLTQKNSYGGTSFANQQTDTNSLLQQALPGTGPIRQRYSLFTSNIAAKIGAVDLVSVTGYGIYKTESVEDFTPFYSFYSDSIYGVAGASLLNTYETKKFTQEFRLSSGSGGKVEWLLGAFYTSEDSDPVNQKIDAADGATGASAGLLFNSRFPSKFSEYAAFGDITVHFTDRFDVQLGGRWSSNRQAYTETDTGPLVAAFFGFPSPLEVPTERTKDTAFTFLVTPRLRLSTDTILYARLASGYRPGGPNSDALLFGYPLSYKPDKTKNYEVGIKTELLDRRLFIDASVYSIDWDDIQISVTDPVSFFSFYTNAGKARSRGVELSVQAAPAQGLEVSAWASWNDAVLKQDLPQNQGSAIGFSGDRLPYSSKWSANASIKQEFALWNNFVGYVGGNLSYVGDRQGGFVFFDNRAPLPSFVRADLRAGFKDNSWDVVFFIKNLNDKRGVLNARYIAGNLEKWYTQPRTIGLSVTRSF